jgi:hypothetical protein
VIFKTFFLVCGVLVVSVEIDLVATSLFLLLDFIIIIFFFCLGVSFSEKKKHYCKTFLEVD